MNKIVHGINQILRICFLEFRNIFKDSGVVIVIVGATLAYPLLYSAIYKPGTLYDVPVAVVDECHNADSREFLRRLDAAPEIKVAAQAMNMAQAQELFRTQKIHGIIYIPADFGNKLAHAERAVISAYCDMSSLMYYRSIMFACNYAMLDMSHDIQLQRLNAAGITGESAQASVMPIPSVQNVLFNENGSFFFFLIPAILIIILHQTLVFGIGMMGGQSREDGIFRRLLPPGASASRVAQVVTGKALCYLAIYSVLAAYVVGLVPRWFGLPHLGNAWTLLQFMLPFLLATIFFALTLSVFMFNRETGLVSFLFFSLILLFLSGVSWPQSNISGFWRIVGDIFPSTHGVQGYIKINSMGASLRQVTPEYIALWIQAAFFFVTACFAMKPRRAAVKPVS